jgi:hypothetical protein
LCIGGRLLGRSGFGGFLDGGDHVVKAGGFFLFELGRGGDFVDDEEGGAEAGGGGGFGVGENYTTCAETAEIAARSLTA